MKFAFTSYLLCPDQSDPVRAPFCRGHQYALFCPHREQENRCHWDAADPTRDKGNPVTSDFAELYRKVTTQISIALLPTLTA
jgi:hypothetical protein